MEPNWTSIVPPVLAVVLAFATRDAIVSLVIACLAGVMLLGQGPQGFPDLITRALGTEDFIWIAAVEVFIGVLVAFLQRSGAIELFRQRVSRWVSSRRQVGLLGWSLGLFVFFSDYFSPLFVGAVMRNITDSYRISREKLAYICDSTSACVSVMIPISAWAVYLSGLAVVALELEGVDAGMRLFLASLPYNFYAFLTIVMVGAIASEWLPDFGPMRAAEDRARQTGKVLRDGANPMMGRELTDLEASASPNASIWLNFIFPVALIIGTNVATFAMTGAASVLDSLMVACLFLGCVMWLQRLDTLQGIMQSAMAGIKGRDAGCDHPVARVLHQHPQQGPADGDLRRQRDGIVDVADGHTGPGVRDQCVHQLLNGHVVGHLRDHDSDCAAARRTIHRRTVRVARARVVRGRRRWRCLRRPLLATVGHHRVVFARQRLRPH